MTKEEVRIYSDFCKAIIELEMEYEESNKKTISFLMYDELQCFIKTIENRCENIDEMASKAIDFVDFVIEEMFNDKECE